MKKKKKRKKGKKLKEGYRLGARPLQATLLGPNTFYNLAHFVRPFFTTLPTLLGRSSIPYHGQHSAEANIIVDHIKSVQDEGLRK